MEMCHHKIKFMLTFSKYDQILVEICTVVLYFGSDICQIKLEFVQVNPKSVRKMSDVRLLFRVLLPITIIAHLFYHDTIIITIAICSTTV